MSIPSHREQTHLVHASTAPLVKAIREAGFDCDPHTWSGSQFNHTSGVTFHVTRKSEEHWAQNVRVECWMETGKVRSIVSKVLGQRTITLRSINEANVKKVVQRIAVVMTWTGISSTRRFFTAFRCS